MAFRRKARKTINLEFITADENKLVYEVVVSQELSSKLIKFGEAVEGQDDLSDEEQVEILIKFFDEILGAGAMAEIKEKVFEGDELLLTDMLDIGWYIIGEVNKFNSSIDEDYPILKQPEKEEPKPVEVTRDVPEEIANAVTKKNQEKLFTFEEVQRLLNDSNKLPN